MYNYILVYGDLLASIGYSKVIQTFFHGIAHDETQHLAKVVKKRKIDTFFQVAFLP